jgi:uncharacterized iron-regulated membrane protein
MRFAAIRRSLFVLHMWIGLGLGLLLAVLGLSGSVLIYDDQIANLLAPPPKAVAQGPMLPLDAIIAAARQAGGSGGGEIQLVPPQQPGDAASVRIGRMSRMGAMAGTAQPRRQAVDVLVDPVSGKLLGTRNALLPPVLTFAHRLHGNFLMGRAGRRFVGWLGVGMVLLGLSGLVLWWPRRGQWKYAFLVRRTARGLRFHRELHAMLGIWAVLVFIIVSFSGVVLAWPQTLGAQPRGFNPRAVPAVEPLKGVHPIGADRAVAIAHKALPGALLRSVTLPGGDDRPITVSLVSHGAIAANVVIDPYRATVLSLRDPSESVMAWQRPVHQGTLGPVWKFLVFLSGLLPTVFVVTGVVMWAKKRTARIAMNAPLPEGAAP